MDELIKNFKEIIVNTRIVKNKTLVLKINRSSENFKIDLMFLFLLEHKPGSLYITRLSKFFEILNYKFVIVEFRSNTIYLLDCENIHSQLENIRIQKGLSLINVSYLSGLGIATIGRIRRQKRELKLSTVFKYLKGLDCNLNLILNEQLEKLVKKV